MPALFCVIAQLEMKTWVGLVGTTSIASPDGPWNPRMTQFRIWTDPADTMLMPVVALPPPSSTTPSRSTASVGPALIVTPGVPPTRMLALAPTSMMLMDLVIVTEPNGDLAACRGLGDGTLKCFAHRRARAWIDVLAGSGHPGAHLLRVAGRGVEQRGS